MARTFTTAIVLPSDPSSALQAATKQYVDNNSVPSTRQILAGTGLTGGGSLAADRTLTVAYGTTSTTACAGNDSRVTGAAPTASPTFTGTMTVAKMVQTPVVLTDAATIAVDASLGNIFRVTLGASRIMGAPSNPTDGQMIIFEIGATGAFTISTWNAVYVWGTDIPVPTLSATSGKTDYVGFIYNSTAAKWRGIALARGY